MRRSALPAAVWLVAAASLGAQHLTWQYEGYGKLPRAAADAHRAGTRLLVGLSGSGT